LNYNTKVLDLLKKIKIAFFSEKKANLQVIEQTPLML